MAMVLLALIFPARVPLLAWTLHWWLLNIWERNIQRLSCVCSGRHNTSTTSSLFGYINISCAWRQKRDVFVDDVRRWRQIGDSKKTDLKTTVNNREICCKYYYKRTFETFITEIAIWWIRCCWPTTVKGSGSWNSREGTWTTVSSQAETEAGHRRTIRAAWRSAGHHRVRHWSPSVRETIAITAVQLVRSAKSTSSSRTSTTGHRTALQNDRCSAKNAAVHAARVRDNFPTSVPVSYVSVVC